MSRRVYEVLCEHAPRMEPYSIDESFLDLAGLPGDIAERCRLIRADVLRRTKIPSCVGIGPSKVISKLANALAKDGAGRDGVLDLTDEDERQRFYAVTPVSEV